MADFSGNCAPLSRFISGTESSTYANNASCQPLDTISTTRLRRCTVERPFALLKYVIFVHPCFLLRRLRGAQTEISLATLAYNLKTMMNALEGATIAAHASRSPAKIRFGNLQS